MNVTKLAKAGATVSIERDAGVASGYSNEQYEAVGAKIVGSEEVGQTVFI